MSRFENSSVGYVNESDLNDVRQIDIEVLRIENYLVGVTHEVMQDFEEYYEDGMSPAQIISCYAEFVFDLADSSLTHEKDTWYTEADLQAIHDKCSEIEAKLKAG